jgi:hypothetical protein
MSSRRNARMHFVPSAILQTRERLAQAAACRCHSLWRMAYKRFGGHRPDRRRCSPAARGPANPRMPGISG